MDHSSVSISRIDFDKHTDIILQANKLITDENKKVRIYGAENRLYVHHKLKDLEFDKWWMGKFPKRLPLTYEDKSMLRNCKYVVDMSIIKNDGGGTQYTFLEAIHEDCVLILHKEWIEKDNIFISGFNCIGVTNGAELADIINENHSFDTDKICINSKKLLHKHCKVEW